jgi:hypothetical protein
MRTLIPPQDAKDLTGFWTWMADDGICRTVTKPGARITINEAKENSVAVNSFFTGKKFPLLVDVRHIKHITREARSHFSTNGRDTKINSFALIVQSPLSRVIGNFFMSLNKPEIPARLFDNEDDAIAWLQKLFEHATDAA